MPLPDKANHESFNPAELVKIGWKFHRLGEKEMYEFLRILPMSIADLLNEWFENDLLKAALAASGMLAIFRRTAPTGNCVSTCCTINSANPTARSARQALSAVASAISPKRWPAPRGSSALRSAPRPKSPKIATKNGAATGVILGNGDEIDAAQVISSADVKQTFLEARGAYLSRSAFLAASEKHSRRAAQWQRSI